jgi:hypothetical protein
VVDRFEVLPGLTQQRIDPSPLEGDRRALRVMLVVGSNELGGRDDVSKVCLQRRDLRRCLRPLGD